MKRIVTTALFASLLASTAAFADGGIGHNGSYNDQSWMGTGTKTRAEVRAELNAAWRDGTLYSLNKTTYPNMSLTGQTQGERLALQEHNSGNVAIARAGQ
jgi:opacity protein-like surface antigen